MPALYPSPPTFSLVVRSEQKKLKVAAADVLAADVPSVNSHAMCHANVYASMRLSL